MPEADVEAARAKAVGRVRVEGELPSAMFPPTGCRFNTRCPAVQPLCLQEEPPMQDFGDGHLAACHFPLQTPVALCPPHRRGTAHAPSQTHRSRRHPATADHPPCAGGPVCPYGGAYRCCSRTSSESRRASPT